MVGSKKEIAKCLSVVINRMYFVIMYSCTFETFENVIREAREELSTYRDILEILDRINKVEPRKDISQRQERQADGGFKF